MDAVPSRIYGTDAVSGRDKIACCATTQQVTPLPNLDLEAGSGTQKYRDKDKKMGEGSRVLWRKDGGLHLRLKGTCTAGFWSGGVFALICPDTVTVFGDLVGKNSTMIRVGTVV
jgi:hypothetical protein